MRRILDGKRKAETGSMPTTQASMVLFQNITTYENKTKASVEVKCTRSVNGRRLLVLAMAVVSGSFTGIVPANGTYYYANPVFGLGDAIGGSFVVYNGCLNSGEIFKIYDMPRSLGNNFTVKAFEYDERGCYYNTSNSTINPRSFTIPWG